MSQNLVAVVTGASRGAGRGIAIGLGQKGYTVYVTGRTTKANEAAKPGQSALPGTIHETAAAVTAAGGKGIAVAVDHADDAQIKTLFEQVDKEQGRLDILVNNVAFIHDDLIKPGGFWEKSIDLVKILDVGLRSQYIACYYAAPIMVRAKKGLVVFTSSFGGVCYMHGAAYGAQKAGVDKFAADMAVDFKDHNIAAVSIWLGPLKTERTARAAKERPDQYAHFMEIGESPEFSGHIIDAMYKDPDIMKISGQTWIGAEAGVKYGIKDDGKQPPSYRNMLGEPRIPHPAIVI
ncbi:MAG: SDR family NAD(P)-dependent oxidoreductase [Rhodospirillaceae bacterium]|nr:SDR family NAD(P)-dependent oxidoreductase [Rhodospirillaceae bacterium]